ncbi:hypothetical protein K503DRAFT_89425 [Rhizopogon vinicolor AM-OR11-026]|uniref:Uncharacterized protein n=1 Tax=Rhizopogon vinicolor AM-OR11-026 TaxID=1314800 RepID=A0A1B7NFN3_9AGAM|nr:hypothetical protein K503DRAFT_89425 [Rhizopogon vinicolor AM-OR11-026]
MQNHIPSHRLPMNSLTAFKGIGSVSEVQEQTEVSVPHSQLLQSAQAGSWQDGANHSQSDSGGIEGDQKDELSGDESEFTPSSRDISKQDKRRITTARRHMKLTRKQRALCRGLASRSWEHKHIATLFHVSLPVIYRTVHNSYVISDDVSEDTDFYKESELEELIRQKPPAPPERKKVGRRPNEQVQQPPAHNLERKKGGRPKKQVKKNPPKFTQARKNPVLDSLTTSPSGSVSREEDTVSSLLQPCLYNFMRPPVSQN